MTAAISSSPGAIDVMTAHLRHADVRPQDDITCEQLTPDGELAGDDLCGADSGELRWHNASIATYSPATRLFRCGQCSTTATLARQLAEHWLGTHADFKAFQCPRCPYMSSWQRCVRMHLVRHHGDRISEVTEFNNSNVMTQILARLSTLKYDAEQRAPLSPLSPAVTESTPSVEETEADPVGKRHYCPHCPYSTHRRDLYNRHENIHKSDKPFQCYICLRMFNRADHVKKHFLRIHRDDPYDVTRIRRIPPKTLTAQVYYSRAPTLTTSVSTPNIGIKAKIPPDIKPITIHDVKEVKQERKTPTPPPPPPAASPPLLDTIPEHERPQVLSPNPKVLMRQWAKSPSRVDSPCRKPYPSTPAANEGDTSDTDQKENRRRSETGTESTDSEGLSIVSRDKSSKTPRNGAYACSECSWRGFDSWCLKRHMNTHTKPYACPLCPYKAARSERLTWHASKVHYRKICIKCFFVCEDAVTLSVHQITNHQNGQARQGFTCVVCALPFALHTQLESHMVTAHGRQMLDCGVCMFRTTDPAVLTDHVRYSHRRSASPPVILNVPSVARSEPASSPELPPPPPEQQPPLPAAAAQLPLQLPTCDQCVRVRPPLVCTHAGSALHCQAAGCGYSATAAAPLEAHVAETHADGALRCPHCAAPLGSVLEFCLHWPLHHVTLCWSCAELTEQHFTVLPPPPPVGQEAAPIDCSPFLRMEMTEGGAQHARHGADSPPLNASENHSVHPEDHEDEPGRELGKRSRKQRCPQKRPSSPQQEDEGSKRSRL